MTAHLLCSTVQLGLARSGWAAILFSPVWLGAVVACGMTARMTTNASYGGFKEGDPSMRTSSTRWVRLNRQGQGHGVAFSTRNGELRVCSTGSGRCAWRGPNRCGRTPGRKGTVASGPKAPPWDSKVEALPVRTAVRSAQSDQSEHRRGRSELWWRTSRAAIARCNSALKPAKQVDIAYQGRTSLAVRRVSWAHERDNHLVTHSLALA